MTNEEQLQKWVEGESIHNHNPPPVSIVDQHGNVVGTEKTKGGMCCPDFSCCQPELKWPKQQRERFAEVHRAGNEEEALSMQMEALVGLLDYTETRNVHIADPTSPD